MPGIFLNCLLTSITTAPPALPTACIDIDPNKYGNIPPINKPTTTKGLDRSKLTEIFSNLDPSILEKTLYPQYKQQIKLKHQAQQSQ